MFIEDEIILHRMMRILILGSGGRECTFAWKLSKELSPENIFIAPGNAGTAAYGTNVSLSLTDFRSIGEFCIANEITTLLPGGEDTLVAGIRNYFEEDTTLSHIYVFGPDKTGAMMEGSKDFAKKFMHKYGIPTARYQSFVKGEEALAKAFLRQMKPPYVIKADGLAAGKGVVIPETLEEAEKNIDEMLLNDQFGSAGNTIVIEEFLTGIEVSCFLMTDGRSYIMLPEAKDYKRIGENDTGLNTGGMGAVSPVPFADKEFMQKVIERIAEPSMRGLQAENIQYRGFLFMGLINVKGDPYVIEYNCRMGDPETEVVMPRLNNKLSDLFHQAANGTFSNVVPSFSEDCCCTVMLVSGGYPGDYIKGMEIQLNMDTDSLYIHAGTVLKNNQLLSSGGRVMAITSHGKTLQEALSKSYKNIQGVSFEGMNYRRDIGKDLL